MGTSEILPHSSCIPNFQIDLELIGVFGGDFEFLRLFHNNSVYFETKIQIVPEGDKKFDINTKVIGHQSPSPSVSLDFGSFLYYPHRSTPFGESFHG